MSHVKYIDKTRAYYLGQGYEKPYNWAHFDDVPFARLEKPLNEARLTIVSTSDVAVRSEDGDSKHADQLFTGFVYSIASDTPADRLYSRQEHYDKYATHLDDVDSYFPITRLREAADDRRIGSVAPRLHGVFTGYSQSRTLTVDAPEVLRRCREDGVDAAVMTPV